MKTPIEEKEESVVNKDNREKQELLPASKTEPRLTTAELAEAGEKKRTITTLKPAMSEETSAETQTQRAETGSTKVNEANPPVARPPAATAGRAIEQETGPLFLGGEANELRGRWDAIQVGFVDEPRKAVEQADNLVAGTMKRLAEIFAEERGKLESQWDQGENASTEDLRLALRRYRSFFARLLSV
jgi:hypothetical protein